MSENIPPPIPRHNRTTKLTVSAELLQLQQAPPLITNADTPTHPPFSGSAVDPFSTDVPCEKKEAIVDVKVEEQDQLIVEESKQEPEKESQIEKAQDQVKELTKENKSKKQTEEYDELANPYDLAGYQKLSKIGEGTYGVVFKARQRDTNKLVALKKIRLNLQEGVPTTTIREVAILKEMNHENIVKLVDMIQRDTTIYLVFDYSEVDLRKYMDKTDRAGLTSKHIKSFMHQLLKGLHYCHSHRILHRDLKPQNLLIDRYGRLSIADLGLSRAFGVPMRTYTHQVITLWYRAPEILLGSQHYSTAVDMWSVGCIMAEMITMAPLFPGSSQIDELFRIFSQLGTPNEAVWPGISTLPDYNEHFPPWKTKDLRKICQKYEGYIDLPDSAFNLLESMLAYDPVSRISAVKAEEHVYFYDDITMLQV